MKRDTEPGLMSAAPKGSGSVAAVSAGLLAVIISYAGPLAIFFQAAHTAHVGNDVIASWVWSISMGAAVSGIAFLARHVASMNAPRWPGEFMVPRPPM